MGMDKATHSMDVADRPEHITMEWLLRPTSSLGHHIDTGTSWDNGKTNIMQDVAVADRDPTRLLSVPTPI